MFSFERSKLTKSTAPKSIRAIFAVLIAACLFGTSASARALAEIEVDSIAIAFIRLFIGAVGLLFISLYFEDSRTVLRMVRLPVVWAMSIGIASYQYFFFVGTDLVGVALGTLISLALAPFFAGILGWMWKGSKPGVVWFLSTVTAVIGLTLISFYALNSSIPIGGVIAALLASLAYASYTVLGSESAEKTSAIGLLAVAFALASLILLPFSITRLSFLSTSDGLLLSFWLGVIATALAYAFFAYGLPRLKAGVIATLNLAEPLVATILGVVILGEQLGALAVVGCVLIAIALSQLALSHR